MAKTGDGEMQKARIAEAITAVLSEHILAQNQLLDLPNRPLPKRPSEIKIIKGNYDIRQLIMWRAKVDYALVEPVVLTAVDGRRNRITIGIEPATPRGRLETTLAKLGVPLEAVIIEETRPYIFYSTLRDRIRPIEGGIQTETETGIFAYLMAKIYKIRRRICPNRNRCDQKPGV